MSFINHTCWVNQKFMPKNIVKPVLPPSPSLSLTHTHTHTHTQTPTQTEQNNILSWHESLTFNRTQSRVVNGLCTGHNTLRRHLHQMGLTSSPLCKRWGAEDETLAHTVSVKLSLHSDIYNWGPLSWIQRTLRV
jgi:hypothetical protein